MKLPLLLSDVLVSTAVLSAEPLRIAVIPKGGVNDYWKAAHAGAAKAALEAQERGQPVELILRNPPGTAPAEQMEAQKAILAELVRERCHAILLAPAHTVGLKEAVAQVNAAKIPIALFDSGMSSEAPVTLIATNNYKAGRLAAMDLAHRINGKGKVILVRYRRGVSSTEARENGFLDTIKSQFPGIEIVSSTEYAGGSVETARKASLALLEKFGAELSGVFCANGGISLGFAEALRERAVAPGKYAVVGFDSGPGILDQLQTGYLSAIVVQDPFTMGYQGVKALLATLQDKSVEKVVDTECVIVTAANLKEPRINDLLHPPFEKYLK